MLAVKSMDVRENFKALCDKVFHGETLVVSRPKNENIVMMSENKYNEIMKAKRNAAWKLSGLPGLILKAHDSENDYVFTAVGLTTDKGSTPIYYKGKTFEPIDRKSLTSIYKKYYADPIGYLLQDAKYAAIVKIKDEKGNILKHSKRAEPYNPIER